jgi:hypothetical protein
MVKTGSIQIFKSKKKQKTSTEIQRDEPFYINNIGQNGSLIKKLSLAKPITNKL